MLHWIVRNGVWLDSIQSQLPQFVTVASMQIYEDCNFEKVKEHLVGPLWRVMLLDGATRDILPIKLNGYQVVMPVPVPHRGQDCKIKEEEVCCHLRVTSFAPVPAAARVSATASPTAPSSCHCRCTCTCTSAHVPRIHLLPPYRRHPEPSPPRGEWPALAPGPWPCPYFCFCPLVLPMSQPLPFPLPLLLHLPIVTPVPSRSLSHRHTMASSQRISGGRPPKAVSTACAWSTIC